MNKGALIGKGMTAEVYEWGQNKVLKLYHERFSREWIQYEANIGTAIHDAGVPSPAVYEIVEVDGRKGIVFQRIYGKSMLKHIQAEPWNICNYASQLARLQFSIHQCTAGCLPTQTEKYSARIHGSSALLGDKEQKILNYIDGLPDGTSVCHGDFHFNNIIVSGNKLVPVDWTNAYQGNPLGDVARTFLMMNSPGKTSGIGNMNMLLSQYRKWLTYWTYLSEYMKLANVSYKEIDAWILPTAAAKLRDRINGEESWLLGMINKRLSADLRQDAD